ncbi:ABC transporter substrate-binding protein [Paracoccus sp. J39]|uniref:ABC transporter substrate-binding protein n=1 Tax=Paracoccus sp. J39 TaxID=935848 RepID=UPI0004B108BF|nr:ABC transporter substrate-binding protein [Paracoccus sp. J39]
MTSNLKAICAAALAVAAMAPAAQAETTIKLGASVPLTGAGATWGQASEWACKRAAKEINEAGGVKMGEETAKFECVAYDNKYTAADGSKVAQTLINRDRVSYALVIGTGPAQALQSLSERAGVPIFTASWAASIKGEKTPLSFTLINTPLEVMPPMVDYVTKTHPEAKTVSLLFANDATGNETEPVSLDAWKSAGVEVLHSDRYERGTTDFQPIALRLASGDPDIIDLGSTPPADAGLIFKELANLGWTGIKTLPAAAAADGLKATGGAAVEGVYMALSIPLQGEDVPEKLAKLNEDHLRDLGEAASSTTLGVYDTVYAIKAGIEQVGANDPKQVAEVLGSLEFDSIYGGKAHFGGAEIYGVPRQIQVPVFVTQVVDDKLETRLRVDPPAK